MRSSRLTGTVFAALAAGWIFLVLSVGSLAQDFDLVTEDITDRALADALVTSFNLEKISDAGLLQPGRAEINRAVETERLKLEAILHGFGYLTGKVHITPETSTSPAHLTPLAGPRFQIGAIAVKLSDTSGGAALQNDLQAIAQASIGASADGSVLRALERSIVRRVEDAGYPHPRIASRSLTPDRQTGLATVVLDIETGETALFGPVTLLNARAFTPAALQDLLPFSQGENYSAEKVDALRTALGLWPSLRMARVSVGEVVESEGTVPIEVRVQERVDKQLLSREQTSGQLALAVLLALLALRQLTVAAGADPRSMVVRSETIGAVLAGLVATSFVLQRMISFAGTGPL